VLRSGSALATASDGAATASDTFVLTVTAVNETPELAAIGTQLVAKGRRCLEIRDPRSR
jgi:hypothetical protein